MKRLIILYILFIGLAVLNLTGQTKDELERQRKETERIIENTNRLLEETSINRQSSMERLNLVSRRLQLRQSLIATLESEIAYIDNSIENRQKRIGDLEKEVEQARDAYARLIRISYKQRYNYQRIMFILAADDFNQAYRRFKYLQQYTRARRNQVEMIREITAGIVEEIEKMEHTRREQIVLLRQHENETQNLARERNQQNNIIRDLGRRERDLKQELERQQEVAAALQNAIEELLREEARRAAEARIYELTPEQKVLADRFESNKGGLPWPTERGVVTGFFGEHPHPVLRGIKIQNDGIIISTVENAEVRSVFDGEVRQVRTIPGLNNVILVRHGNYLSVYANLSHVYVRAEDSVRTGQLIGRVFTDNDDGNKSVLHLGIWEENRKLDPMLWLSRQ